jgi:Ala-tRNA(Pro) deacylase
MMTENPNQTAGTPMAGAAELFQQLDSLGIAYETHHHEAAFTVEESRALRGALPGAHIKNLFLRDKKKNIWLVTALEDREIDLKALRHRLAAKGNLSFGNADLLMAVLGVTPGSVTPFGIINDTDGRATVVLDQAILDHGFVNAHPLRNDQTTAIAPKGLLRFLEARAHQPLIVDFGEIAGSEA